MLLGFDLWNLDCTWRNFVWLCLLQSVCREEIEKQRAHERYMRLQEQGKTDQARKDLGKILYFLGALMWILCFWTWVEDNYGHFNQYYSLNYIYSSISLDSNTCSCEMGMALVEGNFFPSPIISSPHFSPSKFHDPFFMQNV